MKGDNCQKQASLHNNFSTKNKTLTSPLLSQGTVTPVKLAVLLNRPLVTVGHTLAERINPSYLTILWPCDCS